MQTPLVTVICLCYNHERFVVEAIESVLQQTYSNIQLIVVDDASMDGSVMVIRKVLQDHPEVSFILSERNEGNCKAFNKTLPIVRGDFIIDLAADDVLLPDRIEKQVSFFQSLEYRVGIIFSDAIYIDEHGQFIRNHYEYLFKKKLLNIVPEGDVFSFILRRYFISTPTMMMRTEMIRKLNGYDEELSYEDFDLWVRASREYLFAFQNERLTKVRKTSYSMSSGWYKKNDPQLLSTYKVCLKAKAMLRNEDEKKSLAIRSRYEFRQSVLSENDKEAKLFYTLLGELQSVNQIDRFFFFLSVIHLPLTGIRKLYHLVRYS